MARQIFELTPTQVERIAGRVAEIVMARLEEMHEATTDEVLTLKQACERFKIGENALRDNAQRLGGVMMMGRWRFSSNALKRAIKNAEALGLGNMTGMPSRSSRIRKQGNP